MDIFEDVEHTDIIIDNLDSVFKHFETSFSNQIAILELMKHRKLSCVKSGWDEYK